jgi:Carbohydrate binding module (family 6)
VKAAGAAIVVGASGGSTLVTSAGQAAFVPGQRDAVPQPNAAYGRDIAPPAGAAVDAAATWVLRWSPSPNVEGLGAFEGVEDDRANSHPAGQPHIFVEGDHYRFNMHLVDRDTMTDRQRQEVKGMVADGGSLILNKGETWKLTHQVFVPTSLKATTSFCHIMQTKAPGTGSLPMITMSLRRHNGVEKIELVAGGTTVGIVDLVPIKNKWIDVELEMTIGDSATGRVRWVLRDGATTLIDATRSNVDIWLEDRVRPKWGIYRSLGDTSGSLQDCFMFTRNHRAYEWTGTTPPPTKTVYEAENAVISQGAVESNWTGFTGTGFVNLDNVVGSYVEWTVNAPAAGPATLTFRYANGTTAARPMDIRVNGAMVAAGLSFIPTPAWNDWDTRTIYNVQLVAGANKVRATSTTSTGGPNLDNLEVQLGSTTIPVTEYQAEAAVISQGAVESNHSGFTGTGFVNLTNIIGSYVEFTVTGPASKVDVRFANGTTANRPMSVNGVTANFPPTANWDTWAVASVPLAVAAGSQKIRLTSTTATGGPNLDKITLS